MGITVIPSAVSVFEYKAERVETFVISTLPLLLLTYYTCGPSSTRLSVSITRYSKSKSTE